MATIYQTQSDSGAVVYSDAPVNQGSQAVKLKPLSVSSPGTKAPQLPRLQQVVGNAASSDKKALQDTQIKLVKPKDGETLWNQAKVQVETEVSPMLPKGATVRLLVDGRVYASSAGGQFAIEYMNRGERQLQVEVVSSKGKKIAASKKITIYVHRTIPKRYIVVKPQGAQ